LELGALTDGNILWIVFTLFVGTAMAVDLGVIGTLRKKLRSGEPASSANSSQTVEDDKKISSFKQALAWTIVWISLAMVFAGVIYMTYGFGRDIHLKNHSVLTTCLFLSLFFLRLGSLIDINTRCFLSAS
jgi:hypothetical protein